MDIAEKIKELNAKTDELVKGIEINREQITKNNALVRKLATQLKRTNEILGIGTEKDRSTMKCKKRFRKHKQWRVLYPQKFKTEKRRRFKLKKHNQKMNKLQILLAIGFLLFGVALIDQLYTHAANFSQFNLLGKFCCAGIVLIIGYWIYLLIAKK
jgi:hypothetical protein